MNFRTINLNKTSATKVSVLMVQLELNKIEFQSPGVVSYSEIDEYLEEQISVALSYAEEHNVDLVIFPELSIPESKLGIIKNFVSTYNCIVIGGSHYFETQSHYINRCPIFIGGEIYFTEKTNCAPIERTPIKYKKHVINGKEIFIFKNTRIGNFATVICADFLDDQTRLELMSYNLDFIVITALQNNSQTYYDIINPTIRSAEDGIYVLYCNCLIENVSDGGSALFGIMNSCYHKELLESKITDLEPKTKLACHRDEYFMLRFDIDIKNRSHRHVRSIKAETNVDFRDTITYKKSLDFKPRFKFSEAIKISDVRYFDIEDLYVAPIEYNEIIETLENENIVLITGDPGMGKTYTSIKLLYDSFFAGRNIEYLKGTSKELRNKQRTTLIQFFSEDSLSTNIEPNKVYYFEDPFGRIEFENSPDLFKSLSLLIDSIKGSESKIIITTRTKVFDQFVKATLSTDRFDKLITELNVRKPSYSNDNLKSIFHKISKKLTIEFPSDECEEMIESAIDNGTLFSPFAISNLLYSAKNITECGHLSELISNRKDEIIISIAQEINQSSLPTKVFLIVTYIFESELNETNEVIYNRVIDSLNKYSRKKHLILFNQIVREQSGYRIEFTIGKRLSRIRFSHSSYSEAVAMLLQSDEEAIFILDEVLNQASIYNLELTYRTANEFLIKDESLSHRFYDKLSRNIHLGFFEADLYELHLRNCLYSYEISGDKFYLEKVKEFVTIENVNKLLIKSNDNTFNNVLRRLTRYSSLTDDVEKLTNLLDWNIIEQRLLAFKSANKAIEIIESLTWIDETKAIQLLEGPIGRKLLNKAISLNPNNRKLIVDLYSVTRYRNSVKKRVESLEILSDHQLMNIYKHVSYDDSNFLVIDDGAINAIKAGFNLLPVGIIETGGDFLAFEKVLLISQGNEVVGNAVVRYNSIEVKAMRGIHSSQIIKYTDYFNGNYVCSRSQIYIE